MNSAALMIKRSSTVLTRVRRFALNNINFMLSHLIWNFDMKIGSGTQDWAVDQKIYSGWVQPALPVYLEKRY